MGRCIRYAPCSGVLAGGAIANVAQSHLHFFFFFEKVGFLDGGHLDNVSWQRNCVAFQVTGVGLSFSNCLDRTQTDATSRVIKSLFAWTPAGDIRRDRQRVG